MQKEINKEKTEKLIAKGEKLAQKGKFKRALKKFIKARELDPERSDIYDRLIQTHKSINKEWRTEDLAESVSWTMKKQEIENPSLELLHTRLEPEWKDIIERISALILCKDVEDETKIIKEIQSYGTKAVYPLIYTLLEVKKGAGDPNKDKQCQEEKKQ